MRTFLGWAGALILLALLSAGIWWSWPILFPGGASTPDSQVSKADAALLQGRVETAQKILSSLPENLSAGDWVRFQKRIWQTAEKTGNWGWTQADSAKALTQYPGNTQLAAFRVWVLLKNQQAAEALKVAQEKLSGTPFEPLLQQAKIENEVFPLLTDQSWDGLISALSQPETTSPELYSKLSGVGSEAALQKNALLSSLTQGRIPEAKAYLQSLSPFERDKPPFDRLQALMAYDDGDWQRALALLKSASPTRENYLILADLSLHLGDTEGAKIVYDQLLHDPETANPLPASVYLNRATLALMDRDPQRALSLLNSVLDGTGPALPPGTNLASLKLLQAETRFQLGEVQSVKDQLAKTLVGVEDGKENEGVLEAALLYDRLFPENHSIPRLWSLFHRHPNSPPLTERLIWALIVTADYKRADQVLVLYQEKNPGEPPWWFWSYQGLLLALEKRWDEASSALQKVPSSWRDYSYYANSGLIETAQALGDDQKRQTLLEDAVDHYTKSLDLLPVSSELPQRKLRSRILTLRGELSLALVPLQIQKEQEKFRVSGITDLSKAADLDPDNLKAAFLLRQTRAVDDKEVPHDQTQKSGTDSPNP